MKRPCYGCEAPKRYLGCHDRCPEYLATKKDYKQKADSNLKGYLIDKSHKLKKIYGGY